jgi:type VI secretion system VgrG family protein
MEEEGIYYFFKHSDGSHQMVVTDAPLQHPDLPMQSDVIYVEMLDGGKEADMRVVDWEKTQELRSGKVTLWDHCFELPGKNLEAQKEILDSVTVGKVSHKLKVGGNDQLEIYDFPGAYAQRFDGVDKGGGDRPADLQKIFKDNVRTVKIRMEQEGLPSLEINGTSYCRHFVAGHKFTLTRHFDADGPYLLTRVEHSARLGGDYRTDDMPFTYENRFTCIPAALPYRPPRVTPKPTIASTQTATVVGPPGEEIFVDKYGRVKVQFHWDRDGKKNIDSSCWVRVAQPWAGKGWGAFFWPRIGHEVVVVFEEGHPDQPLIVGSVYNAENMPPFSLPLRNKLAGIKSASVRGVAHKNFNGIVFNDQKGHEHLAIHSERHMTFDAEYDKSFEAGAHRHEAVSSVSALTVGSLPGGGGSGGGPDENADTEARLEKLEKGDADADTTYDPMGPVKSAGVPGLNSIMVYGENLQAAVGLNHQLAVGNNIQICINPFGLLAGVPGLPGAPVLTGALGAGMGGNMQLTMGTSASFVMGQSFDINLGPPKIEIKGKYKDHIASSVLVGVLGASAIVWVIAYGCMKSYRHRADLTIAFQLLIDVLLIAIMEIEMAFKAGDCLVDQELKDLFRVGKSSQTADKSELAKIGGGLLTALVAAGIAGALGAPALATGEEEPPKED